MNKKQKLKSLFFFLSLLLYTTIISNEYPTIITQPSYINHTQSSTPPTHIKAQERAHTTLHNSHNAHQSRPATHYPTQNQLNTVLSWMSQLYSNTTTCTPTSQSPNLSKTKRNLLQSYDRNTIINTRNNAIEQLNNGNLSISTQTYALSPTINDYYNAYEINTEALQLCTGNIAKQVLHREFIEITKHSAAIWNNKEYKQITDQFSSTLADFTDAGVAFNHANNIQQAINLADACWAIFDCIKAVGEGVVQGICATIDDIIHPIRTAQNILDSAATCGYCIGILAIEIGELGYIMLVEDPDNAYKKLHVWADNFEIINKALQEKYATLKTRDIIKETVAFGTQCYATTKALRGMSILFKNAHKHTLKIIQQISHPTQSTALTTPEGIIICIADNTVENINVHKLSMSQTSSFFTTKNNAPLVEISNPVLNNLRTGSALKKDALHAFNDIIDNYASYAKKFNLTGGDGIIRQLYQIEGSLNGKSGIFEWIIDPNPLKGVTHRRFIEGVKITGKPNTIRKHNI